MQGLTQKERIELESVFAAIYTKKESRFISFYKYFYHTGNLALKNLKLKIKRKNRK
ncbi:hypothetical protein LMG7974_01070 [Campylobacter majalis]|uniref:Uncharacterized protein n=1 Tax=Campylobacter majalis TaxID=2790656 RepID=A0ABN7K7Y5_9BACT|nr:hypothetical protein LMG7974_01070 [Campylobacter majalis]